VEDLRLVKVIGFDMQRIAKDIQDRACTVGLEPVHGDCYSLSVTSRFDILVLWIFLPDDR
jgi:hypothetical protein